MTAMKLTTRRVEKPWGRRVLWPAFDDAMNCEEPVGEIWFEMPGAREPELLVKYLFTSEKLSIQVHPDDAAAQARGFARGKDEAWVILDAEPDSTIAIGTREVMTREQLKAAAINGSIEDCLFWKPVRAGDTFYSPAGTVHAIGAGLTLVEVQQNVDLTYRLWDYGRPRELHLEDGIAVSNPVPYVAPHVPRELEMGRMILCDGPKFVLERWRALSGSGELAATAARPLWIIPLAGRGKVDGNIMVAGEVWFAQAPAALTLEDGSDVLIAYPGAEVIDALWKRK